MILNMKQLFCMDIKHEVSGEQNGRSELKGLWGAGHAADSKKKREIDRSPGGVTTWKAAIWKNEEQKEV